MYSAQILRKTADRQLKKLFIDFNYLKDGVSIATDTKEFQLDVTILEINRYALSALKRLEVLDSTLDTIPVGVDLDLTAAGTPQPTQEETEKNAWFRQFDRLEQLTKLQTLGALRPALEDDLVELRSAVSDGFKKSYITDM